MNIKRIWINKKERWVLYYSKIYLNIKLMKRRRLKKCKWWYEKLKEINLLNDNYKRIDKKW